MERSLQKRAPIYEALERFRRNRVVPFDVPGHKHGRGNPELVELLGERCVSIDVNSMKPLDNLCHPVSVIKEAEELAADAFGAEHAFLMVGGTTSAVQTMILSCCKKGDKIIIQPPVYHPFRIVPESLGREIVYNPLILGKEGYQMDFEQLEQVIDDRCKLFILSSPHNPGGIVWSKETLIRLAEICARRGVLVISDEIHAEMAFPQYKHRPFASVSQEAANNSITFMAPSKTFNIAGIVTSYAIVPNEVIRKRFYSFLEAGEFNAGTIFAYTATIAAYTYGAEWLQQMRNYIMDNVRFVSDYLKYHIPSIKVYQPQASFLVWLDCRELRLPQEELVTLFTKKAGLALNDGAVFGSGGEGFMRLNIGCPRSILEQALDALKKALKA